MELIPANFFNHKEHKEYTEGTEEGFKGLLLPAAFYFPVSG